ncbi:MAG: hypothetical protein KGD57_08375 [Candidatus Lokiarchaeota archaeon]|nr:hypothetical protein [Candidatus Lokiarchaeota archaeon]
MKIKKTEECECNKPKIKNTFTDGCCSLNQIIKCHGDQPINELLKHINLKKKKNNNTFIKGVLK